MSALLVYCMFPDETAALAAAEAAVQSGLAACCQIGAPVRSVYRWEGKVEQSVEFPLICKTTLSAWLALEALLKSRHPYEVPEIIAVPITHGLPAYLGWLEDNVMTFAETGGQS